MDFLVFPGRSARKAIVDRPARPFRSKVKKANRVFPVYEVRLEKREIAGWKV